MSPAEAAAIGEALHVVGVHDKQLFTAIAALVKVGPLAPWPCCCAAFR
jgi:hypothetical protein